MSDTLVLFFGCAGFTLFLVAVIGFFVTKNAARVFFWGILEIVAGSLSLIGLITFVVGDLSGDCALKGLNIVCTGGGVETTTSMGIYTLLLVLGVAGLLDGMKNLRKAKAMKAQKS